MQLVNGIDPLAVLVSRGMEVRVSPVTVMVLSSGATFESVKAEIEECVHGEVDGDSTSHRHMEAYGRNTTEALEALCDQLRIVGVLEEALFV